MVSNNRIENVAVVGAGGRMGGYIARALLEAGRHHVSAITRQDSTSILPEGITAKKVDYNDHASLVDALRGQDVLIITMGVMAQGTEEKKLIEAAAEAKVPFVMPNEWSGDSSDEQLMRESCVGTHRAESRILIDKLGQSSWIALCGGFWYEWSLGIASAFGFDFVNSTVTLFDKGEVRQNTTTWSLLGRAVVGLLSFKVSPDGPDDDSTCLENYKNSWVYVSSFQVSQKDMLDSALRVTNTKLSDWTVKHESSKARYQEGIKSMKAGDRYGFVKALYSRIFFPDSRGLFERKGLSNEILGLERENIDEHTAIAAKRAAEGPMA